MAEFDRIPDPGLWKRVEDQFALGRDSYHGPAHWRRVLALGRKLAPHTGADLRVVELFAVFHDSRRANEAVDPGHGARGAELAVAYHGKHFELEPERLEVLLEACRDHTSGGVTDHPTLSVCWDADRLDLWRVGIYPDARYLCTEAARRKETIEWAVRRSMER